jgi:serine/threonine protein kinase/tetratricopeptide (TPR) repeat protein
MIAAAEPSEARTDLVLQSRYQIVRRIGQGGMGAVYEAIDTRLGNVVAIKQTLPVPLDDLNSADDPLKRAFEREARILASLRHPALPVVSDFFTEDTAQYLVMQYIPGDDLWTLLHHQDVTFTVEEVIEWADALLDVLDYLHTHQPPILHRDIKPQNLKLTPRGEIVLLDFGLARGGSAVTSHASAGSLVAYTPQYAPMEQIRGLPIGARSDLYALAATVYHLLTGQLPASAMDRAAAALEGRPDPLRPVVEFNPHVSPIVSDLIMRAMSPRVEERPANAAAMRAILRRVHRPTRHSQTTPVTTPRAVLPLTPLDTVLPASTRPKARHLSQFQGNISHIQKTIQHHAAHVLKDIVPQLIVRFAILPPWMRSRTAGSAMIIIMAVALGLAFAFPKVEIAAKPAASGGVAEVATRAIALPTDTPIPQATRNGYERAIETLSAAIDVHPADTRNYISRAEAYRSIGELDKALADYDMLIKLAPENPTGYLGRAQIEAMHGKYTPAIDSYSHAIALDPSSVVALIGRAESYAAQGDYPRAIDDYDRVIELNPGNITGYRGRGQAYMRALAYRQALADLSQAITISPNDAGIYIQRGLAYVHLAEYDRAIGDYDIAVRMDPEYADAYLHRGRAAFYQRAYERAIADYNQYLLLVPESPVGLYNRGLALSARGEQTSAISDFDAYLQLRPDDPDIYLYRGMAYARIGERDRAIADFQKCLSLTNDSNLRALAEQELLAISSS